MIDIVYQDSEIIVCIKPAGVLSTDEEGGMPEALRSQLGLGKDRVFTVHRLDRVVSGLMVYAVTSQAAAAVSKCITDKTFEKEYLAVVHGRPEEDSGRFDDLLFRDREKLMTFVVKRMRKGVRDASLEYEVLGGRDGLSLVRVHLLTGRTHQIRVQFSSRKMPLYGEKKYAVSEDKGDIALWSAYLSFIHPKTHERMSFDAFPPNVYPWSLFDIKNDRN